jgi:quercetin dioxygenase-like cupin family protein
MAWPVKSGCESDISDDEGHIRGILCANWRKIMRRVSIVILTLVFLAGYAVGQRQVPTQNVGQSEQLLRSIDLTNELDSSKGRPLRMRKVTLQPGGVLGLHNHVDRPAVTYLLQGQMTYHQDGKPDLVANPGDGFAEGRATDALGGEYREGAGGLDCGGYTKTLIRDLKLHSVALW